MLPLPRTCLYSAILFAIAFGLAHWRSETFGGKPLGDVAMQGGDPSQGAAAVVTDGSTPDQQKPILKWHDSLLQQALDGRDLASAVRDIMAKQQDDHCADTRIFCLVESLPAGRMGELVGLLEAFSSNAYVHKFVLRAWAQRDVTAALAYIETHPEQRSLHLADVMEGWTQRDPQAALAWLDGKHSASEARSLRASVLGTIANTDPAQAMELLQTKGWLAQTPELLRKIMHSYGAVKPAEAVQALRSLLSKLAGEDPDGSRQNFQTLYRAMLNGMWQANPTAVEGLTQQLTPEEKEWGKECYQDEITFRSPGGIDQLLRSPMDSEIRRKLFMDHNSELLQRFAELPDDAMRADALRHGHDSISALTPAMMEFIEQRPPSEKEDLLTGLVGRMGRGNAAAGLALWKQLSAKNQVSTGPLLFKSYAAESPDLALAELQKCPESVQETCVRGVCIGMTEKQPQAALDLALMQTDPAIQGSCLAGVFGFWVGRAEGEALKALEANASRMDLAAVLAQLPAAGNFQGTSYGIDTQSIQKRIRELLHLPEPTPTAKNGPDLEEEEGAP